MRAKFRPSQEREPLLPSRIPNGSSFNVMPIAFAAVLGVAIVGIALTISFGVLWGQTRNNVPPPPPDNTFFDDMTGCRFTSRQFLEAQNSLVLFLRKYLTNQWIFEPGIIEPNNTELLTKWPNWTASAVETWNSEYRSTYNSLINAYISGLTEAERSALRASGESIYWYLGNPYRFEDSPGFSNGLELMCDAYGSQTNAFGSNILYEMVGPDLTLVALDNYATSLSQFIDFFDRASNRNSVMSIRDITIGRLACTEAAEMSVPNIVDTIAYAPFLSASAQQQADALAAFGRIRTTVTAFNNFLAIGSPYDVKVQTLRPLSSPGLGSALLNATSKARYTEYLKLVANSEKTPAQIHALGLASVAQLQSDFVSILQTYIDPSIANFLDFKTRQLTNATFAALFTETITVQQKINNARLELDEVKGLASQVFQHFPRTQTRINLVPGTSGATATVAIPATDGTGSVILGNCLYNERSGGSTTNLSATVTVTRGFTESVVWHEGWPGHCMQLQIAVEQPCTGVRAFGSGASEGWALYAELVAKNDMGRGILPQKLYPHLSWFGNRLVRAARLVVDTGLHDLGWSRTDAVNYMVNNTYGPSVGQLSSEVDRYIIWPGQAVGYLIGSIAIEQERARANSTLGSAFDLREWHDVLIRYHTPSELTVKERTDFYISQKSAGNFSAVWPPAAPAPENRVLKSILPLATKKKRTSNMNCREMFDVIRKRAFDNGFQISRGENGQNKWQNL